ncbi:leukocyte-associated immunoglobulin-like receptor 1 isoform X2 [Marmota flaviventris]|uniref:leukocyte-associated immunoglobulin-like receptor 1 isoform X2 n=1 Tax=Marmota flaviventris TaxID=93162 RepID=UPI003A8C381D
MAPCSIVLLALGLCLGQEIHAQEGALPRPSISADPGSVIPRGRPVTIVCRGPAGVQDFRLEKEGRSQFWDKENSSPSEREARFLFPSMSEDTAGRYHCLYQKSTWSELSEDLRLVLSREDVTQVPTPVPAQPSDPSSSGAAQVASEDSNNPGECCDIPHEPGCALGKGKDRLWWWSDSSSASGQFVPVHRERPLGPPGSDESDSPWQQSCAQEVSRPRPAAAPGAVRGAHTRPTPSLPCSTPDQGAPLPSHRGPPGLAPVSPPPAPLLPPSPASEEAGASRWQGPVAEATGEAGPGCGQPGEVTRLGHG